MRRKRQQEPELQPHTICWIVTDGLAGNVAPARGLAEALGLRPVLKTVTLSSPWTWLPPRLWAAKHAGVDPRKSDPVSAPWPHLVISCGWRGIGAALLFRRTGRTNGVETLAVHIQDPRMNPAHFDLVVAPAHDRLSGPNVEVTTGSVHGLSRAVLDKAADQWRDRLGHDRLSALPSPRIAVLIGGGNSAYRLDADIAARIGASLADLAAQTGGSLMVTTSRRTGAEADAAFRQALADCPNTVFWDGTGDNPYRGYLGLADRVLVTGDSVNMVSEATATGKPVQVIHLPAGGRTAKFDRFHLAMEQADATRPYEGALVDWQVRPLDDTTRVAARVQTMLDAAMADDLEGDLDPD